MVEEEGEGSTPTAPARDSDAGGVALLIVDMIAPFDFNGAEPLVQAAGEAARVIADLRAQATAADVPVIYVNDNFGQWHSERGRLVDHARRSDAGRRIVGQVEPRDRDYFLVKPQFSAFYATNLPVLLPKLGVSRLVLTGVSADVCVLFTAGDAHMRDYDLWVPEDAVAAMDPDRKQWALRIIAASMDAETEPTPALSLGAWIARGRSFSPGASRPRDDDDRDAA